MIRRQVSAVLLVRDALTGRRIAPDSGMLVQLDGRIYPALKKPEGYLVLTDQAPGVHRLVLRRHGYQDKQMELSVPEGGYYEGWIDLLPGPGYRFPADTAWVYLNVTKKGRPLAEERLWISAGEEGRLKLAQDSAKPGDRELKLFCRGPEQMIPVPGEFILGEELLTVKSLQNGTAVLAEPLERKHPRGQALLPVQQYVTDPSGQALYVCRALGRAAVLCQGKVEALPVIPGRNEIALRY